MDDEEKNNLMQSSEKLMEGTPVSCGALQFLLFKVIAKTNHPCVSG